MNIYHVVIESEQGDDEAWIRPAAAAKTAISRSLYRGPHIKGHNLIVHCTLVQKNMTWEQWKALPQEQRDRMADQALGIRR